MIAEIRDKEGEQKKECKEGKEGGDPNICLSQSINGRQSCGQVGRCSVCVIEREKDVFVVLKKVFIQVLMCPVLFPHIQISPVIMSDQNKQSICLYIIW